MVINFEIDENVLITNILDRVDDDWKSDICEKVTENIDASDVAEHIDTSEVAGHIDMDDLFSNVEIDYEELSELIIHADNFKTDVAALMWQQFSEEFGASMKCVREEIAVIHRELDDRAVPFWKRWFNNGNKKETDIA